MSKLIYLSKSDFRIAKSCPTKLYYKKLGYPQNQEENYGFSFSALIITKIAQLLYKNGIEISVNTEDEDGVISGINETNIKLQEKNITLFKPLIYHQNKLARLDILAKRDHKFDLIYIKPRAIDIKYKPLLRNKKDGKINSIWKGYLEDITFQVYILSELLASLNDQNNQFEINTYLCLPIKDKLCLSCLGSNFSIFSDYESKNKSDYKIEYLGNIEELKKDHILQFINVNREIEELKEKVIRNTNNYLESIVNGFHKIPTPINKNCKNCEFRLDQLTNSSNADTRNGFNECWNHSHPQNDHILDLYQVAKIGEYNNPLINTLIAEGKSSLYDIPIETLDHHSFKTRQIIQIKHTKKNQEWISEQLAETINTWNYPLHFIDFETCRLDIAYDQTIRPNEQLAFQWSCHTISTPTSECINTSFIDISGEFPNFKFAEALMEHIGNCGTVLIWGTHEKSVLKDIYAQVSHYQYDNQRLSLWLESLIFDSELPLDPALNLKLIDMNNLTLKYYFHPLMKGRTSLKSVLPAIWKTNSYLHQMPWLSHYLQRDQSGKILNPYETLPELEIDQKYQVIKDGSGAMLAYQQILYSPFKHDPAIRAKWEILLKQYCCLDTLAMVIIWTHWQYLIAQDYCSNQAIISASDSP
ncbi:protein of unknown function(DUF2779) [Synechococcus sp. PCC 7502]|uniref:DUF2779 domain-containing protein n=1 Tax=Synechococcus sp. PCC 7502 TaxID=1173263 RepID=UPI00029FAEA0|nr:DUF2779 domain-containing protein [Synechococcus sp. PCC 7502]AFY74683.1 protein of unknown function(DUF2779) [Synechococcus sp. PCC 7502]